MRKIKTFAISLLVAACAACLAVGLAACSGGEDGGGSSGGASDAGETLYGYGEEGFYYYDGADSTRYMLSLQSGTYMMTANGNTAYSGSYDYDEETGVISFSYADGTFAATAGESSLSLDLGSSGYSFKAYRYFDVTYVDGDGNIVATESVLNGQTAKGLDAENDGYWFIGWYEDSAISTEFAFDVSIAGDTTVYGWFIEKNSAAAEYEITLDYGDGTHEYVSTMNGAVWTLPTDGVIGWWVSATNKSGELTYEYNTGDVFTSDTTLFAVYEGMGASVTGAGVTWVNAGGADVSVTVYDADGETVVSGTSASTSGIFMSSDFTALGTGTYTVEVTSGSVTETLTYVVNGLARVSMSSASVITNDDGRVLSFSPVEGAKGYRVTVSDGTDTVTIDLGSRTYYNFSGWEATNDGFTFVVTAYASGFVESVSDEYFFAAVLENVALDVAGDDVVWNRVENALEYEVTVTKTDGDVVDSFSTSETSFTMKYYDAGTYDITVRPRTSGYYSEETTYYGFAKTAIASPVVTNITYYTIYWGAVTGAASYVVLINGVEYTSTATSLSFTSSNVPQGEGLYEISIKAIAADGDDSSFGDPIYATEGAFASSVSYNDHTLTWDFDVTAVRYTITLNGQTVTNASGSNSYVIEFKQAGENVIGITAMNNMSVATGYAEITVYTYTVILDGNGAKTDKDFIYVAEGDSINPGSASLEHATFVGWYTQPDLTEGQSDEYEGNGSEFETGTIFTGTRNMYLYAYWTYDYVDVTLVAGDGTVSGTEDAQYVVKVKYNSSSFTLPGAESSTATDEFMGWYTGDGMTGIRYTSGTGEALGISFGGETTLYAGYEDRVLVYELTTYNGKTVYSVSAGSRIDYTDTVTIPETYEGYDVIIASGAFKNCALLKVVNIPDTVLYIATVNDGYRSGTGAFEGCSSLKEVNITYTGNATEPLYFSVDGVLFHKTSDETEEVEVLYYPYAKTVTDGTYALPSEITFGDEVDGAMTYSVTSIPMQVFRDRNITEITIPASVTTIASQAFYGNTYLTKVTFTGGGSNTLTIGNNAFAGCTHLTTVALPARLSEFNARTFEGCTSLTSVTVETGSDYQATTDGVLLSSDGTTLVFYPTGKSGDVAIGSIANTITKIAADAFASNTQITSVTVSSSVTEIGESAFEGCRGITSLTFSGDANSYDLAIKTRAFYDCILLGEVALPANLTVLEEDAFGGCLNLTKVFFDGSSTRTDLSFTAGAFGATSHVVSLELGTNVPGIDFVAIFGGDMLQTVTVAEGNSYFSSDSYGAVYNADGTTIYFYPTMREGEYTLLETTTEINDGVFQNKTGLTAITIPASVNTLGTDPFDGCTYLEKITVANGNTNYASDDSGILYARDASSEEITELIYCPVNIQATAITVASTVTKVSDRAFQSNKNVVSVTFLATESFELGEYAFDGCSALTTVVLPDCMTEIPDYAFRNCSKLSSVNIPTSVTEIGDYAFYYCSALYGDLSDFENGIKLPYGLETIGTFAFGYATYLAVTIPASVEEIKDSAFAYCWNNSAAQSAIVFAEGTGEEQEAESLTIGDRAFQNAQYATAATVPARTTSLGKYAFTWFGYMLSSPATFTFADGCQITKIDEDAFYYAKIETIDIPASVVSIADYAFEYCTSLKTVTFAGGNGESKLETIAEYVFERDSALTSIEIPASVKSIGGYSFSRCTALTSFTFAEGSQLTTLGSELFYNSTALTSVAIPGSVTTLGTYVFESCSALTTVTFGGEGDESKLTSISSYCFYSCSKLTAITIPASVTSISSNAFYGCTALASVTFETDTDGKCSLEQIGSTAFRNCTSLPATFTFPVSSAGSMTLGTQVFYDSSVTCVELSSSITDIGGAFISSKISEIHVLDGNTAYKVNDDKQVLYTDTSIAYVCYDVTSATIEIPDGIQTIGASAFNNQTKIEKVILPASLTTIENYAFYGCTSLKEVSVATGSQMGQESLGTYAFYGCTKLTKIDLPTTLTTIPNYCFYNCDLSETTIPGTITSVGNYGLYGTKITEVTMTGSTTIGSYAFSSSRIESASLGAVVSMDTYAFDGCSSLVSVSWTSAPETIANYAFRNCTALETITIPSGVTDFGTYVFDGCTALYEIDMPDTITTFGNYAFRNTKSLLSVTLPEALESIGQYAFDQSGIVSVEFNDGLKEIKSYGFARCYSLEKVSVGKGVTTVASYAFWNCTGLVYAYTGDTLTELGTYMFSGDTALEIVEFGAAVVTIGNYAFQNCSSLANITLKTGLGSIGNYAFYGCTAVESLVIPSTVYNVGSQAFYNCTFDIYTENTQNYISTNWNSAWSTNYKGTAYVYTQNEPGFNADGTDYDGNYWYYGDGAEITIWTFSYTTYAVDDGGYVLCSEIEGTATVSYVCLIGEDGASAVYTVGECTETDGVYTVALESGDSYTVVLNSTDMTATVIEATEATAA